MLFEKIQVTKRHVKKPMPIFDEFSRMLYSGIME
jgi:hypothetical protein